MEATEYGRLYRIAQWIDPKGYALVDNDQPDEGYVVVTWANADGTIDGQGERCDGWVIADRLFLPFDGQSEVGANIDPETGLPDGPWYESETGQEAILGLSGSPLAVFA